APQGSLPDPAARLAPDVDASFPDAAASRDAWMKLTAMPPSPTADAQRLTDPLRTSPAAKTPGRLVSRRNGPRPCARQRSPRTASSGTAAPVRTKPVLSSCTQP